LTGDCHSEITEHAKGVKIWAREGRLNHCRGLSSDVLFEHFHLRKTSTLFMPSTRPDHKTDLHPKFRRASISSSLSAGCWAYLPLALAMAMPSACRSLMRRRSNSANAARIPSIKESNGEAPFLSTVMFSFTNSTTAPLSVISATRL